MTITAIAKQLNVSTMTIYRRLKRAGVNVDDLRDAKTGEVTAAGASLIASLFDGATQAAQQVITGDATGGATGDAVTVAVLQAKLDAATDTIERLEAERDRLLKQLDAVTAALQTEQADRQHERLLLTGSDGNGQQRAHWWQNIFKRG